MNPETKLNKDIKKFLEVYKFLSAEGKAQFEAQMAGELKGKDQRTRKLYYSLLKSAKDGKSIQDAIKGLEFSSSAD